MTARWIGASRRWGLAFLAFLTLLALPASAADFSSGLATTGASTTLWFKPAASMAWVDAHYAVNGGAQQNVRMNWNATTQEFETPVAATAGQAVDYAFTYDNGTAAYDSAWFSATVAGASQAATPTFSPPAASYASPVAVSLASASPGAVVHYTTDGTTPTAASPSYATPFTLPATATVRAVAVAPGLTTSAVASATYTIGGGTGSGDGFTQGVEVAGSTATVWFQSPQSVQWVDIHYDAGGGLQNVRMGYSASHGRFEQAVNAAAGTTIHYSFTWYTTAAADTAGFSFTVPSGSVAAPTVSPAAGSYAAPQAVTLADATPGATIHYTLDGSTPGAGSPTYAGPLQVSATTTVKAIATLAGGASSAVTSATFTITTPTAAVPTFAPAPGSYSGAQAVTLADATPGAAIHFTTDGSTPSAASPVYAAPLSIATTTTLRAIAVAAGFANSGVGGGTWTIVGAPFVQGVTELGATATVWFKPASPMNWVILHDKVGTGAQNNPQMAWNASLGRWEFVVSPLSAGNVLAYSFTYSPVSGAQQDTPGYTYTMGADNGIARPAFSPAPGTYATAQTVTLTTTASNATIRYTTDGSAPNALSPVYSAPLQVARSTSITAISLLPDGSQSAVANATYVIGTGGGTVAAPVLSLPTGTYATHLRVTMTSTTPGATLHYTTDGSTPGAASPIYGGPLEISATTTVQAIALAPGMAPSAPASATYTLTGNGSSTWNGLTTFNLVNATHGKWSDSQVYWAIIGKDWKTGQFVHVDASGNLVPMSLGDNGALTKNGLPYSNYFFTLAQTHSITVPPINSARLLMSVGGPMYIWVNQDVNGHIGYAGANIENPADPNIDVTFDFGEFAILPPGSNPQGIFVNTTRVDQFGFPVKLSVTGLDGFSATVGEPLTESRDELFARFIGELPSAFAPLAQAPYAPYRIVAPAHATFLDGGPQATYLDAYITQVWNQYATQDLVIDLHNGWLPFTGRVSGNTMHFTDSAGGNYYINGKPTTSMVLLGDGLLNDPSGASDVGKQLQLQAQVCAALNRQVAQRAWADWWNSAYFYPKGRPANWFAKFWHDHSIDALAYGFAYDDVGSYSPSVHTEAPTSVTFTVGW